MEFKTNGEVKTVVESMVSRGENMHRDNLEWVKRYRNKYIIPSKKIIYKIF
jgi:hypothetical protein